MKTDLKSMLNRDFIILCILAFLFGALSAKLISDYLKKQKKEAAFETISEIGGKNLRMLRKHHRQTRRIQRKAGLGLDERDSNGHALFV